MTALLGFMPDAPAGTSGAIVAGVNIVPIATGIAPGPPGVSAGIDWWGSGSVTSAIVCKNTRGVARFLIYVEGGSNPGIWERTTTDFVQDPLVAPIPVGEGVVFASFGDIVLVTSTAEKLRASIYSAGTGPTAFVSFTTSPTDAPKANILVAGKNFALAFDTDDVVFGVSRDRWWCSAFQDALSWTINPVTQANTGRLVGIPGPIKAAAMLGDVCIAYKESGAYIGREAGPPYSWQWEDVDSHFGCVGKAAVCDVDGSHFVVGPDDVWLFDGTRPVSVAEGKVKRWLFGGDGVVGDMSVLMRHKTMCVYERENSRVWMFYVKSGVNEVTGNINRTLVYSLRTGKWGVTHRAATCAFDISNAASDSLGLMSSHIGDLAMFSGAAGPLVVTHTTPATTPILDSSFTVGDTGDHYESSFVRGAVLNYNKFTSGAAVTTQGYTRDRLQGTSTLRSSATQTADGRLNFTQDGRWHWFTFLMANYYEVDGYTLNNRKAGRK